MINYLKLFFTFALFIQVVFASYEPFENNEHPSVFKLYHRDKKNPYAPDEFAGSAVMIQGTGQNPLFALTCAHCIEKDEIEDLWFLRKHYTNLRVSKVVIHPLYDENLHDIALLKLEPQRSQQEAMAPALLPEDPHHFFDQPIRSYGYALQLRPEGYQIPMGMSVLNRYYSPKYYGPAQDHVYGSTITTLLNYKYKSTMNACENFLSSFNTVRIVKSGQSYQFIPDSRDLGVTIPGMSGGGSFDSRGNLVALNSRENIYHGNFWETGRYILSCLKRSMSTDNLPTSPSRGSSLLYLAPYKEWIESTISQL